MSANTVVMIFYTLVPGVAIMQSIRQANYNTETASNNHKVKTKLTNKYVFSQFVVSLLLFYFSAH